MKQIIESVNVTMLRFFLLLTAASLCFNMVYSLLVPLTNPANFYHGLYTMTNLTNHYGEYLGEALCLTLLMMAMVFRVAFDGIVYRTFTTANGTALVVYVLYYSIYLSLVNVPSKAFVAMLTPIQLYVGLVGFAAIGVFLAASAFRYVKFSWEP